MKCVNHNKRKAEYIRKGYSFCKECFLMLEKADEERLKQMLEDLK